MVQILFDSYCDRSKRQTRGDLGNSLLFNSASEKSNFPAHARHNCGGIIEWNVCHIVGFAVATYYVCDTVLISMAVNPT